jgi:hypothetical protein
MLENFTGSILHCSFQHYYTKVIDAGALKLALFRSLVITFCKSCTTCMWSKSQCHQPYNFLQQFPIPKQPWNSIYMDFIEQLPGSLGFTAVLVVVCRLTKQSIFIPTYNMIIYNMITSANLANLFVLHVFSKHGVPSHVTSD